MQNRIRELREIKGLTQKDLARRIGATDSLVSRLESGQRQMTTEWLTKIADVMGVEPADIIATNAAAPPSHREVVVAGIVSERAWLTSSAGDGKTIPVVASWSAMDSVAFRVDDNHAGPEFRQGDHIITTRLRARAEEGQVIVVVAREGRLIRRTINRVIAGLGGPGVDLATLDGGHEFVRLDDLDIEGVIVALWRWYGR